MAEDVHRQAREVGDVCSITYPFPEEELQQHGKGFLFCFVLFLCFFVCFFFFLPLPPLSAGFNFL